MADKSPGEGKREESILKLYAIITVALVLIAIAALILPRGTPLQQCTSIILPQSRDACLGQLAFSSGNLSICAYVSGQNAGSCYSSVAIAKLSPSICQKAGSASSIGSCITQIANRTSSISACSSAAQPYRDSCISSVAINLHSSALCSAAANLSARAICISIININFAGSTLRPSYCYNVSNSTNKTLLASIASSTRTLFSSVNATATLSSLAVAPFIATNYTARDMCYTYIASKTSNASICARTGSYASALCTYSVSGNYSSAPPTYPQLLANCNQLSSYKSECVQYVKLAQAIATRNASICASFPTNFGWQCYSAIAAKYNNATFCGYIANSTANNSCLAQLK